MTVTRFIGLPLRGAIPMIIGVALILLAFIVERYADYILLPTAIASGVVATATVLGSGWRVMETPMDSISNWIDSFFASTGAFFFFYVLGGVTGRPLYDWVMSKVR